MVNVVSKCSASLVFVSSLTADQYMYRRKSREKNDGPTQSTNNFEGVTTSSRENTARNYRDGRGEGKGFNVINGQ